MKKQVQDTKESTLERMEKIELENSDTRYDYSISSTTFPYKEREAFESTIAYLIKEGRSQKLKKFLEDNPRFSAINLKVSSELDSSEQIKKNLTLFGDVLKQNKTIKTVVLTNKNIGDEGVKCLSEALIVNKTLTNLALFNCNISDEGAKYLSEALKQNKTLTQLNLSGNNITDKGKGYLIEVIEQNKSLVYVNVDKNENGSKNNNLVKNSIDLEQVDLESNLAQAKKNTEINLSKNKIKSLEEVKILANFLSSNNTATILNLAENDIGDEGVECLSEALKQNKTLRILNLDKNNISHKGAKILNELLKVNQTLITLDLADNYIGNEGVKSLEESLKNHPSLKVLSLYRNKITDEGADCLSKILEVNNVLTTIFLSANRFGYAGCSALSEALKKNKTLVKFEFRSNNIGIEEARILSEMLENNQSLERIDLSGNHIGDEGVRYLSKALKQNKTLAILDLEHNAITNAGANYLNNALEQNKSLTVIYIDNRNEIDASVQREIRDKIQKNNYQPALESEESDKLLPMELFHLQKVLDQPQDVQGQITVDINENAVTGKFTDDGIKMIAEFLRVNKTVENFIFRDKNISDEEVKCLCQALMVNQTLKVFAFVNCNINDEGAKHLSELLKQNKTLIRLSLTGNSITTKGIGYLSEGLEVNLTLEMLWVDKNNISNEGGQELVKMLRGKESLLLLASNNNISEKDDQLIKTIFNDRMKHLEEINNFVANYLIRKFDKKEEVSEKDDLEFIKQYKKVNIDTLKFYLLQQDKSFKDFEPHIEKLIYNAEKISLKKIIVDNSNKQEKEIEVTSLCVTDNNLEKFSLLVSYINEGKAKEKEAKDLIIKMKIGELNLLDENGQTLLHIAVAANNESLVKMLIKKSPGLINVKDNSDNTALLIADLNDFSNIVELLKNFTGNGTGCQDDENYWHEYSKVGMQELLQLRLTQEAIKNTKIISLDYIWDNTEEVAVKLGNIISSALEELPSLECNSLLVPMNLYNKHWVGLVVEKNINLKQIVINYMDSEQNQIPEKLYSTLMQSIKLANPIWDVTLVETVLELQKYNNCGPETIENIILHFTGYRFPQEKATTAHSLLLEGSLTDDLFSQEWTTIADSLSLDLIGVASI